MQSGDRFVKSERDYNAAVAHVAAVFDTNKSLPSDVFLPHMAKRAFLEFSAYFVQDVFISLLQHLTKAFNDDGIYIVSHDPSAEVKEYWGDSYGVIELKHGFTNQEYVDKVFTWDTLPSMSMHLCTSVYIVGTSGKWGIYGDYDFEVFVVGVGKDVEDYTLPDSPALASRDTVLDIFQTNMVTDAGVAEFLANYFEE